MARDSRPPQLKRAGGPVLLVRQAAVEQLQTSFLTSFRFFGGPLPTSPDALDVLMPAPADPGQIRTTVLHNVPGAGHLANTDTIELLIEGAERRLDVICPYVADRGILERMMAAARLGGYVSASSSRPSGTSGQPLARWSTGSRISRLPASRSRDSMRLTRSTPIGISERMSGVATTVRWP